MTLYNNLCLLSAGGRRRWLRKKAPQHGELQLTLGHRGPRFGTSLEDVVVLGGWLLVDKVDKECRACSCHLGLVRLRLWFLHPGIAV